MRTMPLASAGTLLSLVACNDPAPVDSGVAVETPAVLLSPTDRAARVSMTLRGIRPSADELAQIAADPEALGALAESWVDSPEFLVTMRDLHSESLLVRTDGVLLPPVDDLDAAFFSDIPGYGADRVNVSLMEEPLRLVAHVIDENRPYTEIVTANYTVVDRVSAPAWGLAFDENGPEWQEARYVDGRRHAGVLTTNALWIRHETTGSNVQRGRANLVSNALLCHDFLSSDVVIDTSVDLADTDAVSEAVVANESCAACHQTLDPLGSYLWGFEAKLSVTRLLGTCLDEEGDTSQCWPWPYYQTKSESRWEQATGRAPSYFGTEADGLAELGTAIAEDPRFAQCAVRRFYAYFHQGALDDVPSADLAALQRDFVASGYDAKQLALTIALSDDLAVSHGADEASAESAHGVFVTRPEQMARSVYAVTGFQWLGDAGQAVRGFDLGSMDLTQDDLFGYRALAGGIDGERVLHPVHTATPGRTLFLRTFAAEAAGYVVSQDFAEPDVASRRLFLHVEADTTDEQALRAQLVALHASVLSEPVAADSATVDRSLQLFDDALAASGEPTRAWTAVLAAFLQDPRFTYY